MNGRIHRLAFFLAFGSLAIASPAWSQQPTEGQQADEVGDLIQALANPAARIRGNAVKALKELDSKPYDALVAELAKADKLQAASVALVIRELQNENKNVAIPENAEKALYAILYNPTTKPWRWNIAATLLSGATANSGVAVGSLKKHVLLWTWGVQHPASIVQLPSLRALQKIGEDGKTAEDEVAALLNRSQPPLTSIVIERDIITHGYIGLEYAFPTYTPLTILETLAAIKAEPHLMVGPLMKLTHHPSDYVRLDAAAILGKLETADVGLRQHAAHVLAHLVMTPWSKVRLEAVTELGNIGEPAVVELQTLIRLLKDKNDDVRLQAAVSLGRLEGDAKDALPELEKALELAEKLDQGDPVVRISEAIAAIKEAMKKEKPKAPQLPSLPN